MRRPRAVVSLACVLSTLASSIALRPGQAHSQIAPEGPKHAFPVPGPHGARGAIGEFGASRNDGRVHEGFDVTAKCGAKMVAARGGTVIRRGFHAPLYGNYVLIAGEQEDRRTYFYAHLSAPAVVGLRDAVTTGQRIGSVGDTGNAQGTGCHLHFEIRVAGSPINPEPALRKWDRVS